MKQIILSILLYTALINPLFSQQNKDALVKEAEEKLKNTKATISQILTDKKYDAVHPETSFRRIIEKYCKAETISIATGYNSRKKNKSDRYSKR
jgi:endonuclease III